LRNVGVNVNIIIKTGIGKTGCEVVDWIHLTQDKIQWWGLVKMGKFAE
jgi:hypothetical protein